MRYLDKFRHGIGGRSSAWRSLREVERAAKRGAREQTLVRTPALMMISLMISIITPVSAEASPDDRGALGSVYTLSLGGFVSAGTGADGERSPSQLGGGVHFMLGEEVLSRLFIGLGVDSYFGSGQGGSGAEGASTQSQAYALGLEARYRLTSAPRGLVFIGGIGFGVGGVIREGETLTDAEDSGGGSVWKLGLGYELGDVSDRADQSGFIYLPQLLFQRIGPQMDSEVSLNILSLGLEVVYASGREREPAKVRSRRQEIARADTRADTRTETRDEGPQIP